MKRPLLLLLLAAAPAAARVRNPGPHDVRYVPFRQESVTVQPFRHHLKAGSDLCIDAFEARLGTETLKGLYSRAQPFMEYRYSPGPTAEVFFRGRYTAQNVDFNAGDGRRVYGRYSAGGSSPEAGVKLRYERWGALLFQTSIPTHASRDPRLGDGAHFGGALLFKRRNIHLSLGHTARLSYMVHAATETLRRSPGAVSTFGLAVTKRDDAGFMKDDYVGPVMELRAAYADRERIGGRPVKDSATLTGETLFGFELGKINRKVSHITRVAVSVGAGDLLHKTEDPTYGMGDFHIFLAYEALWGRER